MDTKFETATIYEPIDNSRCYPEVRILNTFYLLRQNLDDHLGFFLFEGKSQLKRFLHRDMTEHSIRHIWPF